ncbi:hypothetical protein HWV62_14100, partial [Athelia sp. TMB]
LLCPLHLYTMSSLSGLPTYPQLSDINYAEWCINTKALLQSQKLWRLVSGTLKKPDETKFNSPPTDAPLASLEDWEDRSEHACGILVMSISPGQKPNITDCQDDPVVIWTKLKSVHEAQKPSNRFNAYEDLLSIRKDSDESLSSLINCTESCMQLIKNLRTKEFNLDKLDEELQCMALIRALPDEFDSFASTLMITDKLDKASLISAFYSEEIQCCRRAIASANIARASKASNKFFCTFHNQQTNHPSEKCYLNPSFTGPRPAWWNQNASSTSNSQQAHAASSTTHAVTSLPGFSLDGQVAAEDEHMAQDRVAQDRDPVLSNLYPVFMSISCRRIACNHISNLSPHRLE